jgi:hypothetical protein
MTSCREASCESQHLSGRCILAAGGSVAPAQAQPANSCDYELTPPHLETVPEGAAVVTTTLRATACTSHWQPGTLGVRLNTEVGGGQCTTGYGWNGATVIYGPPQRGGSFTSVGSGRARIVQQWDCVSTGPLKSSF